MPDIFYFRLMPSYFRCIKYLMFKACGHTAGRSLIFPFWNISDDNLKNVKTVFLRGVGTANTFPHGVFLPFWLVYCSLCLKVEQLRNFPIHLRQFLI
ncbi:hypothetical protein CW304_13635 [Bacillus sp. UFRGS-B20]|nr:hypothetical protein CW304_13635 [Bacillus sp. UFRGS-B20]